MWYAPATCRYGQTYGWMPQRVGVEPDATGVAATKKAVEDAEKKWAAAYKHAMTYHTDYVPALKANTAAVKAEEDRKYVNQTALSILVMNYAEANASPTAAQKQPYNDAIVAADQQIKFLSDGRVFLLADMAAHVSLGAGNPASLSPSGQLAAAGAIDQNPKPVGTPKPPVSSEDADDPTKPPPPDAALGAPLEWGQIAGWAAVIAAGSWIFWRVVTGRGLA